MEADHLALELAVTIRHDGNGGVADDLADPAGLDRWVRERLRRLALPAGLACDERSVAAVVEVRTAVRALFARAVRPAPPSRADATRLPDPDTALRRLNAAAARVPVVPHLTWPQDAAPRAHYEAAPYAERPDAAAAPDASPAARPDAVGPDAELLAAALARAAITFLAGPDRARLRACPAPRCVRYFVQEHPRQEWCKPSCGNRARVARHHARKRAATDSR
ncbi:CGNR zinc finger domain-containing protein [Streptomyces sp. V4-01]|uniref:CGNR zinc finger domain-containing protein n=1 Tax=Actinacidiphila polyblastidii TaxID=3110430 RepID=A0ABU7PHR9_9ACTN|nr:CGNR zinc finger domain-containing protein [Streptomyces sp. V4-01]